MLGGGGGAMREGLMLSRSSLLGTCGAVRSISVSLMGSKLLDERDRSEKKKMKISRDYFYRGHDTKIQGTPNTKNVGLVNFNFNIRFRTNKEEITTNMGKNGSIKILVALHFALHFPQVFARN